jgi:hypothetical protein
VSVAEPDTVGAAGLDLAAGELLGVEPGVEPVVSEELSVRALLDDPAGLDGQDEVSAEDGGQAVGDSDRGASLGGVLECLLYQPFAGGVQRAGGLVQDQDADLSAAP